MTTKIRLLLALLMLNMLAGSAVVLARQHPCDSHDQACRAWCGEPCCPGSCDGSSCICCCI